MATTTAMDIEVKPETEKTLEELEPWTRLDGRNESWNREAFKGILASMANSREVSAKIDGGTTAALFIFYADRTFGVPGPRVLEVDTKREHPPGSKDTGVWLLKSSPDTGLGLLSSNPRDWVVKVGIRSRFSSPLLYLTTAVKLPWFRKFASIKGYQDFEPDHLLVARTASISGPPFVKFPLPGKYVLFPEDDTESVYVAPGMTNGVLLAPAAWIAEHLVSSRRSFPRGDEIMIAKVGGITIEMSGVSVYYTGKDSNSQIMPKQLVFLRFDSTPEDIANFFNRETEAETKSRTKPEMFATGALSPRLTQAKELESSEAAKLLVRVVDRLPAKGPEALAEVNRTFFETEDADISSQRTEALLINDDAPRYFIASKKARAAKENVRQLAKGTSGEKRGELLEFAKILENEEDRMRREFQQRIVVVG